VREFIRVTCVVVMMIATFLGGVAWVDEQPGPWNPYLRYGGPVLAVAAVTWFVFDSLRRDRAPDFLAERFPTFFESNGLGFVFLAREDDGILRIDVYFQNRYERACRAILALRPASGWFGRRPLFPPMIIEVDCPGGAFGKTSRPFGVPHDAAGGPIAFDVGARVGYPQGKGRILRYRDGITVRLNDKFRSGFISTLRVLAFLGGGLLFSRPARTTLVIPYGVDEDGPFVEEQRTEIRWQPGDPDELGELRPRRSRSRRD